MRESVTRGVHTYFGVRVSQREAELLQLRIDADRFGKKLPQSLKQRADWLHHACLRMAKHA